MIIKARDDRQSISN